MQELHWLGSSAIYIRLILLNPFARKCGVSRKDGWRWWSETERWRCMLMKDLLEIVVCQVLHTDLNRIRDFTGSRTKIPKEKCIF
jgi:hypothetical protein